MRAHPDLPAERTMRILGDYRLLRRVGVGGMAEVYEAELRRDKGFTKRLAIKLLLPRYEADARLVASFIDEATIGAELSHPNVIQVYDFGEIDGVHFIAMEYVDGLTLEELLRRCRERRRLLPVEGAAWVGCQLCHALDYVHKRERAIIHRDVTPSNVFVTREGHVKLADFGIAKAKARLTHTEDGQIKGKLPYLAPEQLSGDPVTERADVYAAGLLLFELLTGQRYIGGELDTEVIAQVLAPEEKVPSSYSPGAAPLDAVVQRALCRHPAMRTRSAGLLAKQLQGFLKEHPFDAEALAHFVVEGLQSRSEVGGAAAPTLSTTPAREPRASGAPSPARSAKGATRSLALHAAPTVVSAEPPEGRRRRRASVVVVLVAAAAGLVASALWWGARRHGERLAGVDPPPSELARVIEVPLEATGAISSSAEGSPPSTGDARPPVKERQGAASEADVGRPSTGVAPRTAPEEARSASHSDPRRAATRPGPSRAVRRSGARKSRRRNRPEKPSRADAPRRSERGSAEPGPEADVALVNTPREPGPDASAGGSPAMPKEIDAYTAEELQRSLKGSERRARSRGLWPGDDATYDRLLKRARVAAAKRTGIEPLEALDRFVDVFRIDRAFVDRKLWALERRMATTRLADEERRQLREASQQILRLVLAGELVQASRLISESGRRLPR